MAWVWFDRSDIKFKINYDAASPIQIGEVWHLKEEDIGQKRGIYTTSASIVDLEILHCPYVENWKPPIVDELWKNIILEYVPRNRVLFIPIDVFCRDGVSNKYSWCVPYDKVTCIDVIRSEVWSKIEKPEITLVFGCDKYVHFDNCLGGFHLAFDAQMRSHLVLSDQLRNALASTGESAMFYRPENLPIISRIE